MTILEYTTKSTWPYFTEVELKKCSDYHLIEKMIENGLLRQRKGINQNLIEVIK